MKSVCLSVMLLVVMLAGISSVTAQEPTGAITGLVTDFESGEPIPFATVQAVGTGKSALANENGKYRLVLSHGKHKIKFSHVGHYSEEVAVTVSDAGWSHDARLHSAMIEITGIRVYDRALDPGQRIIVEAIKRKSDILSKINDYSYDAYTKFIVDDLSNEDSTKIFLIVESQTTAYWEQPDKYKEVITSRRQTANIPAEGNMMTVGEILNFNRNRLDIGEYDIVSPTATDALDYYNYYLLDTIMIDSQQVFVLEIEPIDSSDPLFVGEIHIADSTFDVVLVRVGFSEAVDIPFLSDIEYQQRMAQFSSDYWMPVEIRFSGVFQLEFPIPGIPSKLGFQQIASLYSYSFETGHPDGTFDEYMLVVDEGADDYDSVAWNARQTIPLTLDELAGYDRIDSLENIPKPIGKKMLGGVAAAIGLVAFGDYELFHFNRVEGTYFGLSAKSERLIPNTELWASGGYSHNQMRWQQRFGFEHTLSDRSKLSLGAEYKDKIVHRPTTNPSGYFNPTLLALMAKYDPYDYYREKGFSLTAGIKPINYTRLRLKYSDYEQSTVTGGTDYSLFRDDTAPRLNPAIDDGDLRSLSAEFSFDSRQLINNKGREIVGFAHKYTQFTAGFEYASPEFIDNDFDFRRYYVNVFSRQRLLGQGFTSIRLHWGASDGDLPDQKYFTVDYGSAAFINSGAFSTLDETNFSGRNVVAAYLNHDFGPRFLKRTGIPLIKEIPWELGIHGGAFWTDHTYKTDPQTVDPVTFARSPYSEIGFGLYNLTPFLSPFNFALTFTWQLSDYGTNDFSWNFGIRL